MASDTEIESMILDMARTSKSSIAPLDVARKLAPEDPQWQRLITSVRRAADRLVERGEIEYLRKGKPIAVAEARGVVRLRIKQASGEAEASPSFS